MRECPGVDGIRRQARERSWSRSGSTPELLLERSLIGQGWFTMPNIDDNQTQDNQPSL